MSTAATETIFMGELGRVIILLSLGAVALALAFPPQPSLSFQSEICRELCKIFLATLIAFLPFVGVTASSGKMWDGRADGGVAK